MANVEFTTCKPGYGSVDEGTGEYRGKGCEPVEFGGGEGGPVGRGVLDGGGVG